MSMEEMALSVDKFLTFNEYRILDGRGRISKQQAEKKAKEEYDAFNKTQKIESDFDKAVKKLAQQAAPKRKKKKGDDDNA